VARGLLREEFNITFSNQIPKSKDVAFFVIIMANKGTKKNVADKLEEEDVVNKFLDSIRQGKAEMVITTGAFNVMCGTELVGDDMIRVTSMVYWAYGEIQLVWRVILEYLASNKYKAKTIKITELKKTGARMAFGSFEYVGKKFFVDCVHGLWTLCLLDER